MQAAGRLALLAKDIPVSLEHHLKSFITSWNATSGPNSNQDVSFKDPEPQNLAHNDQLSSFAKTKDTPDHSSSSTTLTDESSGSSQCENSTENCEMHAFAVQGGNEEMSEGTDSEPTKSNQHPSDETSSLASVSLEEQDAAPVKLNCSPEPKSVTNSSAVKLHESVCASQGLVRNTNTNELLRNEIFQLVQLHLNLVDEEEQDESVKSQLLEKVRWNCIKQ